MGRTLYNHFGKNPGIGLSTGPTLTSTQATDATVFDLDNVLRTVPGGSSEGRFTGQRYVRNLLDAGSEDSEAWVNNNITATNDQVANPIDGAVTADLLTLDSSSTRWTESISAGSLN